MWPEVAAAAMIGVSFWNSWICLLLSFGNRTHSKHMASSFILGRFIGIMLLGIIISLFGFLIDIPTDIYTLIFGIITVLFAVFIFKRHILPGLLASKNTSVKIEGCTDCVSCSSGCGTEKKTGCGGCTMHRSDGIISGKTGFFYGMFRGATPCLKMLILAPLLITTGFPLAVFLTAVFAVTSSAYPIIGFLVGDLITQIAAFKANPRINLTLNIVSILTLLGIGIYYLNKYFTGQCVVGGG